MDVVRLKKEHYSQMISLLNFVFTQKNKREMDFEKELPKMCIADDENMRKHFGIFDKEKLIAVLGVYPLKVKILGEEVWSYTVGNIATHPDYEGKGCMTELLKTAMQELDSCEADLSRLGGFRQRYQRFGYEKVGTMYEFKLTNGNVSYEKSELFLDVVFEIIQKDDYDALEIARKLQSQSNFFVERKKDSKYFDVYTSMIAWKNIPYLAKEGDKVLGYLCVSQSGTDIAECFAYSVSDMKKMLFAWQKKVDKTISFRFLPHQVDYVRAFSSICENMTLLSPSQFKILHWEKVLSAFMKLKASYTELLNGELTVNIENYGGVKLYVNENGVGCDRFVGDCEITLSPLQATRYFFGPLPPEAVTTASGLTKAWLPLPLSWNLQDRV